MSQSYKRARSGSYNGDMMQVVPTWSGAPRIGYGATGRSASSLTTYGSGYRRRYRRQSGPYAQLGSNITHVSALNPPPEIKTIDQGANGMVVTDPPTVSPITLGGTVVLLSDITVGTGGNGRIGVSVVIKNCAYRFEVDLPANATNAVPTSGRVVLVWDRQPNGAVAAMTDIFVQANYLAFGNTTNTQRFVILRNQQYSLSPNGNQTLFFEGFVKINMKSTYLATPNPNSGALLLCYVGDQAAAINQPTIQGWWRVRYVDS